MGCDIHCHVEVRTEDGWQHVWPPLVAETEDVEACPEEYVNFPGTIVSSYEEYQKVAAPWDHPLRIRRNYNLFAIFADVRNGIGFAGTKTGEGFNIIAEPRGIPDDASIETAWDIQHWEGDAHSHSWLTLKDLLDFDWDQTTSHVGVVSPREFVHWKEHGVPSYWSADVSGLTVLEISNEEMEAHLASGGGSTNEAGLFLYTTVTWESKYRDSVGSHFFDVTIHALKQLGDPEEAEDVRLVFFFDN